MPLATQITNTPSTISPVSFAITGVSYTSSTATYTATGHTFNIGDTVIVSDVAPSGYCGTFVITSVVAGSTFTVSNATNTALTVSTGTAWQAPATFTASDNTVVWLTDTTDPAGITTFYQSTTPTALEIGDIWFDTGNGNRQSRWSGSAWVLVQDTSIATALSNAASALANATTAYNAAIASLQPNAYTITNTSNQITAINTNGITVYAGSSPSSGARVIMNSAGIAGYNSGGTATFSLLSSSGVLTVSGAIISLGSITGTTLNVAGQFIVDAFGNMTANSATLTGTVTSANLTATGGHIGGWSISSTRLTGGGSIYLDSSTGSIWGSDFSCTTFQASSTSEFFGAGKFDSTLRALGNVTFDALISTTTTSSANMYVNSSSGLIARVTSSLRYKVEVLPEIIPAESVMALAPKTWIDKAQFEANENSSEGLGRILGLIAEDVAELPVLRDVLVNYNDEGQPDSINYDRIAITLIPLIQSMNKQIQDLTTRVKVLEGGK